MKRPLLYRFAFVLLMMCVAFVVWQESFRLKQFDPSNPTQTLVLWAISILIFLLMVTLGWVLVRTGLKLYIERQANQAGSRIKTKLVVGALALSILPVCFLVWFSYSVLNVNMNAWFTSPAAKTLQIFRQVGEQLKKEMQDETSAQAALLASIAAGPGADRAGAAFRRVPGAILPRVGVGFGGDLWRIRGRAAGRLGAAGIHREGTASRAAAPPAARKSSPTHGIPRQSLSVTARRPVADGPKLIGYVGLSALIPLDVAQTRAEMETDFRQPGPVVRATPDPSVWS